MATDLGDVATSSHVAPAARAVLARVEKQPAAATLDLVAFSDSVFRTIGQQPSRRFNDRPEYPAKRRRLTRPGEAKALGSGCEALSA